MRTRSIAVHYRDANPPVWSGWSSSDTQRSDCRDDCRYGSNDNGSDRYGSDRYGSHDNGSHDKGSDNKGSDNNGSDRYGSHDKSSSGYDGGPHSMLSQLTGPGSGSLLGD